LYSDVACLPDLFIFCWFATVTVNCSKFSLSADIFMLSVQPSVRYVSGPLRVSQCSCSTWRTPTNLERCLMCVR